MRLANVGGGGQKVGLRQHNINPYQGKCADTTARTVTGGPRS
jgi:hypothetical protein